MCADATALGDASSATSQVPLRVSVLTPSFNQAQWLAENLRSVACQTYPHIEHIVMDGGSTDGSVEILESAGSAVVWQSEPDRGQSHAINKAFRASSGEIIGWINSDDAYFDCHVIADVVAFFEAHPDVDVAFGHLAQVDTRGTIIWMNWVPPFARRLLRIVNFIGQPVAFIRRRVLTDPMLDESYDFAMDYELWLRLEASGATFARMNRITAVDRHQPTRKSETISHVLRGDIDRLAESHGRGYPPAKRLLSWGFYALRRAMGATLIARIPSRLAFTERTTSKRALVARQLFSWRKAWPADYVDPSGRIAYLSLQAVVDGQDTWAAVTEIISGFEAQGREVDTYFPHYATPSSAGVLTRLRQMFAIQLRLARRASEYEAVYIRAHPLAWLAARAARRRGVPVIQECNGPYEDLFIAWPSTRVARPVFESMQRTQYREASAIISVSDGLSEWLRAESDNPYVVTNGNGANVSAFSPDAPRRGGLPEKYAVFFGQFPAWQGIGTLLDAVTLAEWPTDLPLVFVGDGAMRTEIERAAAERPDRVMYLGRLPYEQVATVAAHAVVSYVPMVAPEREAKFSPLKLYESMACGVPVIASDTIGISEVVREHDCGILVEPGDAHGIASATARLVSDPALAEEMGARGRQAAVSRFSWSARAGQRLAVVDQAVARSLHL